MLLGTGSMKKMCWLMSLGFFCGQLALAQVGAAPLIEDVGVDQNLGVDIRGDLAFTDRFGKEVALNEFMGGEMPSILVPVYYSCPGLCTAVLSTVTNIIRNMSLELGTDYRVINVSFDPDNDAELANEKASNYRSDLAKNDQVAAKQAWHFLTGTQQNITLLMNQIGFRYKKVGMEYSHPAALVVLTPQGKVARYLTGIGMSPGDTKLAVMEASGGKVGSPIDLVFSYCFRYDPRAGKYVPLAWRIMRIGCLLVLVAMSVAGYFLWKSELVRKRRLEHNV